MEITVKGPLAIYVFPKAPSGDQNLVNLIVQSTFCSASKVYLFDILFCQHYLRSRSRKCCLSDWFLFGRQVGRVSFRIYHQQRDIIPFHCSFSKYQVTKAHHHEYFQSFQILRFHHGQLRWTYFHKALQSQSFQGWYELDQCANMETFLLRLPQRGIQDLNYYEHPRLTESLPPCNY